MMLFNFQGHWYLEMIIADMISPLLCQYHPQVIRIQRNPVSVKKGILIYNEISQPPLRDYIYPQWLIFILKQIQLCHHANPVQVCCRDDARKNKACIQHGVQALTDYFTILNFWLPAEDLLTDMVALATLRYMKCLEENTSPDIKG